MKKINLYRLGLIDYKQCWEWQKELMAQRQKDEIPDTLLLVEHPPTYTLGKGGDIRHLLADSEKLEKLRAEFVRIDRGGDITFHGPGQLVVYPILKLKDYQLDVHTYLRNLEEITIQALSKYGVTATRAEGMTGVWVNGAKIAAIGVRLSRWTSMHGIAINLNTDLDYFNHIVPCGLVAKPVTSLNRLSKQKINEKEFIETFIKSFEQVFQVELNSQPKDDFLLQSAVGE